MRTRILTSVDTVRRVRGDLITESPTRTTSLTRGVVRTPAGLVAAHSFGSATSGHSWLELVWKGKVYRRNDNRTHGHLALARLAGRFARDVVAGRIR